MNRFRDARRAGLFGLLAAMAVPSYALAQDTVTLTGIVRDFREGDVAGGHPDFELPGGMSVGHVLGFVQPTLGTDGKPQLNPGGGRKMADEFKDADGNPVAPHLWGTAYTDARGDHEGTFIKGANDGYVESEDSFRQWFNDVPGINVSAPLDIELAHDSSTGNYVFDSDTDGIYKSIGGFFPIDGQLFGNSGGGGPDHNFHFTFELETRFVYEKGSGQFFTFTGDDDVWVYVDGQLVIDIGGIHGRRMQTISMDRLDWLVDGQMYQLKFFFAERNRTQSNFRLETSIKLRNGEIPPSSGLYD
ncbi:MAG: fibro-slime domain-containing protein [Phycisphaerales bacterium JB043]